MNNKILITGKSGFSQTAKEYLNNNGFECNTISLRDDNWKKNSFSKYNCIIHIAGLIPKKENKPEDFYKINVELTQRLAEKAKSEGISHFIYLSSMSVYNIIPELNGNNGIITEKDKPDPQSDYGKSKYEAENFLRSAENDNFRISIIRAPSIYDETNTAYLNQYRLIVNKFKSIPVAFEKCKKSAIYSKNLFELMRLVILYKSYGIFCPDDGFMNCVDYTSFLSGKKSKLLGFLVKFFLKNHYLIKNLYGNIAYSNEITNIFEGKYRIFSKKYIKKTINNEYQ